MRPEGLGKLKKSAYTSFGLETATLRFVAETKYFSAVRYVLHSEFNWSPYIYHFYLPFVKKLK
jgi:hypothetical protein